MNTFEKIKYVAAGFSIPAYPDVNQEDDVERWITYNFSDDFGTDFADDVPQETIHQVQVHLFLPITENFLKLQQQIREKLFDAGFTYPEITVLTEDETKIRHIIFECETEMEE